MRPLPICNDETQSCNRTADFSATSCVAKFNRTVRRKRWRKHVATEQNFGGASLGQSGVKRTGPASLSDTWSARRAAATYLGTITISG